MRAGAIRGPRYSGRERTKSGILNVCRIDLAAAASVRQAEQRALRDEQRAKEVEAAAKEQEQRQVANVGWDGMGWDGSFGGREMAAARSCGMNTQPA
jgi:hypothetical protein